jgi:hypothetical protein
MFSLSSFVIGPWISGERGTNSPATGQKGGGHEGHH